MRIRFVCLVLVLGLVSLSAQEPPKDPPAPVVTVAELVAGYREAWQARRQAAVEAQQRLQATAEYKDAEAKVKTFNELEAQLTNIIRAKTGKAIDWNTGQLVDPPPAATK